MLILAGLLLLPHLGIAQCKAWVKMDCKPRLGDYIFRGKPATTVLSPGDDSEIVLTFYSKQLYRLVVCTQATLANAYFEVVDLDNNPIYDSRKTRSNTFEFKMSATQQLKVKVHVPEAENLADNYEMGCLAVMVGMKHE